jgi:hypothetical protein
MLFFNKKRNNKVDGGFNFDEVMALREEVKKLRQENKKLSKENSDLRQERIDNLLTILRLSEEKINLKQEKIEMIKFIEEQKELVRENLESIRIELDDARETVEVYQEMYEMDDKPVIIEADCKVEQDVPLLMAPVVIIEEEPVKEKVEFKFISNTKQTKKTIIPKIVIEDLFEEVVVPVAEEELKVEPTSKKPARKTIIPKIVLEDLFEEPLDYSKIIKPAKKKSKKNFQKVKQNLWQVYNSSIR